MLQSITSARNAPSFIAGAAAGLMFLVFIASAMLQDGSQVLVYLRDPAAHFKFSPFAGVISNLGVLATFGSAVVCLFAARHVRAEAALLRAVGLFGLLLSFDDLLMLHEDTLPNRLGLPEYLAYLIYAGIALYIAVRFRDRLASAPLAGLFLALVFLGSSVMVDALTEFGNQQTVIEDGLKFVGLIVWSVYWIDRTSTSLAVQSPASRG